MTSKSAEECFVYITLPGELSAVTAGILSQHARFLLDRDEAEKIVSDMRAQVSRWYDTVRACGVSEPDAETIRGAFVYPGFDL
jgi:hypothetical protein